MANFNKIIEFCWSLSSDLRGKHFERCCKWFLENDPRYQAQLKKVWMWNDWPGNWGRDKGIDLIAESHNGEIWAIQAKAYDKDKAYPITKEDVDKFLSESSRKQISYRLLISTTNLIGSNALEVIKGQEKPVLLCLSDKLEESILDWALCIINPNASVTKEVRIPRPHQSQALQDILAGFERFSFGQLHMACGTGKTLVGLWLNESLQSNLSLVLVPSISLVAQLYGEWATNCSSSFRFFPIFICSDQTVADTDEEAIASQESVASLGFPVTTNAEELLQVISTITGPKVIFSTYQSSPVIKEACSQNSKLNFDLVIADEAHRCAGKANSDFATIVAKNAIRSTRKLFMTATPRIFSDHVKSKAQEYDQEIVSMNDEIHFGPIFYKLPFSAAITQNLLSDYQVIISVMNNKTYQEFAERGRFVTFNNYETDARTLASQLLVAKAIKRFNLKKVITFHNRQKNAQEFVDSLSMATKLLDDFEKPNIEYSNVILGKMTQAERKRVLDKFKLESTASCSVLSNVKCLSEGIDVPEIDGIAFIDPKGSEIDIVQAVGRVIRKPKNKSEKIGLIIIPIFVDDVGAKEIKLDSSCFQVIWKIVKALRAHDDVLAEELDNIRFELGKQIYRNPTKLTKILFDMPIAIGSEFSEAINLSIIENCAKISLLKSHPNLVLEWHNAKNKLTPAEVSAGSDKKVWWICLKEYHEWEAIVSSRVAGNGCPVCINRLLSHTNSLAKKYPELAHQWHSTKNSLTPDQIIGGGHTKYWWKCPQGKDHEWQESIIYRLRRNDCPICLGRIVVYSNCLRTTHPNIAKEWHPTKNGKLTPDKVYIGSHKKVWWQCTKISDHEWLAIIKDRKRFGCGACSGKKAVLSNCLFTLHPNIAQTWHQTKNGKLTPFDVTAGSSKNVWWKCFSADDHEWKATVKDRRKTGCPFCSGKKVVLSNCLAIISPNIAQEWHPSKNGILTPFNVTAGSGKQVWWQCKIATDHEWKTSVINRQKSNCAVCAGKLVVPSNCLGTLYPNIAQEWHPSKNEKLTPFKVTARSNKKVWWRCSRENTHEWQSSIYKRTQNQSDCPNCFKSKIKILSIESKL